MTNKEAINILEGMELIVFNRNLKDVQDAVIVAINALEKADRNNIQKARDMNFGYQPIKTTNTSSSPPTTGSNVVHSKSMQKCEYFKISK